MRVTSPTTGEHMLRRVKEKASRFSAGRMSIRGYALVGVPSFRSYALVGVPDRVDVEPDPDEDDDR